MNCGPIGPCCLDCGAAPHDGICILRTPTEGQRYSTGVPRVGYLAAALGVLLVAGILVFSFGCGVHIGNHVVTPQEAQAACRVACSGAQVAGADAATTNACLLRCDAIVPSPEPTSAATCPEGQLRDCVGRKNEDGSDANPPVFCYCYTPTPAAVIPSPNPSDTSTSSPTSVPTVAPSPTSAPQTQAPPQIDVWRGCQQSNMDPIKGGGGLACDTTMIFWCPMVPPKGQPGGVDGARSCDPGHSVVFRYCCGSREWDDPRGPLFVVDNPAVKVQQDAFGALFLAPPGTVANINTCPRPDVHSCVIAAETGDHTQDCPSGKIPLTPRAGNGCFGAHEVHF